MPVFDVLSDVQGDLDDLRTALTYADGDRLLINGDLTAHGFEQEYADLFECLGPQRPLCTIGNHDFYNGDATDVSIERFRCWTGMPGVWWRVDVDGVRVLGIGSTDGSEASGHCVVLGDTQLDWLASNLGSGPTIVLGHHPLPRTVSGSFEDPVDSAPRLYLSDYAEAARLRRLLDRPNVLLLTGHTHWNLRRPDWLYRSAFTVANTGAVQREFGPDGNGGEQPLDGPFCQGLRVRIDGTALEIVALDFATGEPEVVQTYTGTLRAN